VTVASASASARPVTRDTLPVATVSVLVVAAVIAGLLLGGSVGGRDVSAERPAGAPDPIDHGGLRLQVPSGWARGDAAAISGFSRPLGLQNAAEGLSAAVERLPATSATLLPVASLTTPKAALERPDDIRLASGQRAWRYRLQRNDGSVLVLYAAPTTGGIATVACASPAVTAVPRGCDVLASAVAVPGSQPLEPGTSAAFFSRLPATIADLEAARTKGTRELSAATRATAQAAAADGLARAHKAAGAALAPLADNRKRVQTAAVGALTASATAYAALASAARARVPQPYTDASRTVTGADADLRRAMTKVAAAATAASRTATQAASTPVRNPAASSPSRIDASFLLLALLGVFALCLAARETLGVLHE
jgi:hypothetical protein